MIKKIVWLISRHRKLTPFHFSIEMTIMFFLDCSFLSSKSIKGCCNKNFAIVNFCMNNVKSLYFPCLCLSYDVSRMCFDLSDFERRRDEIT